MIIVFCSLFCVKENHSIGKSNLASKKLLRRQKGVAVPVSTVGVFTWLYCSSLNHVNYLKWGLAIGKSFKCLKKNSLPEAALQQKVLYHHCKKGERESLGLVLITKPFRPSRIYKYWNEFHIWRGASKNLIMHSKKIVSSKGQRLAKQR